MGLDDIRFNWLTSYNGYIAGGAAMNWVWQENTNQDIDFFFTNEESYLNFIALAETFGFRKSQRPAAWLAKSDPRNEFTYTRETDATIQVIGGEWQTGTTGYRNIYADPYGSTFNTITKFDLRICQFAIDCDNIYFSLNSVGDLITKRIVENYRKTTKGRIASRVRKYIDKGFYDESKSKGNTNFMKIAVFGKYRGDIVGQIKNCYVIRVTSKKLFARSPQKVYGFPVRQNILDWGSFCGDEIMVPKKECEVIG